MVYHKEDDFSIARKAFNPGVSGPYRRRAFLWRRLSGGLRAGLRFIRGIGVSVFGSGRGSLDKDNEI